MSQTASTPVYSLYVLKCLMAFLVVSCHVPMTIAGGVLAPVARGAVAAFFLISGYFLYHPSVEKSYQRAIKSIKSTVKIYLIVSAFYGLWLSLGGNPMPLSWSTFFSWLFTGTIFTGHLWYLVAMIEALALLAVIFRWGRPGMVWLLTPLFLFGLLGSQYSFLVSEAQTDYLFPVYNTICYGLPCIAGGYLIARYEARLMRFRYWTWALLGGITLLFGERAMLEAGGHTYASGAYFGSYLTAVLFLLAGLQHKGFGKGSVFATIGQRYSGNIYYFHFAVSTILIRLLYPFGLQSTYMRWGALIAFLASWALAWVIVRVQDRIGVHVLR